jgi:hypothetical protein
MSSATTNDEDGASTNKITTRSQSNNKKKFGVRFCENVEEPPNKKQRKTYIPRNSTQTSRELANNAALAQILASSQRSTAVEGDEDDEEYNASPDTAGKSGKKKSKSMPPTRQSPRNHTPPVRFGSHDQIMTSKEQRKKESDRKKAKQKVKAAHLNRLSTKTNPGSKNTSTQSSTGNTNKKGRANTVVNTKRKQLKELKNKFTQEKKQKQEQKKRKRDEDSGKFDH